MRSFKFLFLTTFVGFCYAAQVSERVTVTIPKLQDRRSVINLKQYPASQQSIKISSVTNPRKAALQKPNIIQQSKQIQRREIPFQQTFLGVPVQIENVKAEAAPAPRLPAGHLYPQLPKAPPVKPLIKPNETEAERAERIHKSFDRLLTFVEIVGQVDNYVSSKWKNLVKTVSNFYETEEEPYRVTSRRIHAPCPYAQ